MLTLGVISLLNSVAATTFCFLIFGGITSDPEIRQWMFICFIAKALTWSPFLAMEYYDMIFECVYHDVQFQLNEISSGSRNTSPKNDRLNN